MIDLTKVTATSKFVGFENTNEPVVQNVSTPATALGAGGSQVYTFSYPVDNARSVSRARIKYVGLTNDWYQLEGYYSLFVAGVTIPGNKDFPTLLSYTSDSLVLTIYVVNTSGAPQVIPAQDYILTYRLFNTPF